jgi:TDG/mug DNA glycosylase family protein
VPSFGFEPIANINARVLIWGSLPGRVSLEMQQYYAQPRNAFWPIMGRLLCFDPAMPYAMRVAQLKSARIALWDVCASADRNGSLDSAIVNISVRPNDFAAFLARYPGITTVYFNGAKSEMLYRNLVMPRLPQEHQRLKYVALPSTSPAHAAMSLAQKLRRWSGVKRACKI